MRSEFVTPDSPRWVEALSTMRHDVYHLPEFVRLAASHEGGEALAFLAEESGQRLFVPLIVRPVPAELGAGWFDATCPRGYPGILVDPIGHLDQEEFCRSTIGALLDGLKQRRIVACFSRLHPLFLPPLRPLREIGELVEHGESVWIDLTLSQEEHWGQTRRDHRRSINKAARQGHAARIDDRWDSIEEFIEIYQETMRRVGAVDHWHLSRDYFRGLKRSLGERLHLCVVDIDDQVAAAGLFAEVDGIVDYHLSGSRDWALAHSPARTMIHFIREWARARGNRAFHLGGSPSAGDSVFDFKTGFSPLRNPVLTWRAVADETSYSRLVRGRRSITAVVPVACEGYFPAYRLPVSAGVTIP